MSSFTSLSATAGTKRPHEENGSIEPPVKKVCRELAPLDLLIPDVMTHILKDFSFKDLLSFERASRKCLELTKAGWKLKAQKNGTFDLEPSQEVRCLEKCQCAVMEVLFLHIKNKKDPAIEPETIKKTHAIIFKLFPRLGAFIWVDLTFDQMTFPRPAFDMSLAKGGDLLLEGLYEMSVSKFGELPEKGFQCLNEAIQRRVSCVSYFALQNRRSNPLDRLYALAKIECEKGGLKGLNHFFRRGLHREFKGWKTDLHLPFIAAQLVFNSGFSWEEKEKWLDDVMHAYNQNLPSWLKARCAYIKFKLGKQMEADQLYKEAFDDFKLSIPERKWMCASKLLKTLYLEIFYEYEDKLEGIKFYEMVARSYPSEDAVPAFIWAGLADMTALGRDPGKADVFFNKAISVSNSKLPNDVWQTAASTKNTLNDWKGLEEICEKALADLAAGDRVKAPVWLAMRFKEIEEFKKREGFFWDL